ATIHEGGAQAGVDQVFTHAELQELPEAAAKLEPFGPGEEAYIQYSSGSTSNPKGVLITQAAICGNTRSILGGMKIRPDDRGLSWLPLYHDMGLVGFCLTPLMGQATVDYLATTTFARRPALWLKLMSDNKSTISCAPSFGYDLAARRINGEAVNLDLSRWRAAGIGGDMVRADILQRFADTLSIAGFDARAFLPTYGMAENTLAIAIADVDGPIRIDTVERDAMKTDGKAVPAAASAAARSFVVCGKPVPGCDVEIRSDRGDVFGDRRVGRIFVKSPSLMAGYYHDDEATRAAFGADGFLDTGDMGYWLDGEIVITGRAKDLILHNGRNIWPQDIEWAAEKIEPLRSDEVAAFAVEGEDGEDDVVVLVQCRLQDQAAIERLRHEVSAVVHQSAGIECKVVMVPPKSLPFTTSGKLSRAAAKQKYLSGEISALAPATFIQAAE
ncbi:MAG TPA: AMP-binding protein, partial [Aestuariivirga sp.]|nr:AMP-binding protein [Aestuariivirga sp.]